MIETPLTLFAALGAGLLGSTHCLGMCGGIAGAVGVGDARNPRTRKAAAGYSLLYNLGRIASYAVVGFAAGSVGHWLGATMNYAHWLVVLRVATGMVMIVIGLQIAFNWRWLRAMEALGARLWRRVSPYAARLLPARTPAAALTLGMLWGWLPCGLVYTMAVAASVSGHGASGALLMAAFGVGTLPSMLAVGAMGRRVGTLLNRPALRRIAGLTVVVFGLWTAGKALAMDHSHHQPQVTNVVYSALTSQHPLHLLETAPPIAVSRVRD